MRTGRIALFLAAFVLVPQAADAQSKDPPRDTGGRVIEFSEWRDMPSEEIVINIGDLESDKNKVSSAKQRIRDNHITHQRALLA